MSIAAPPPLVRKLGQQWFPGAPKQSQRRGAIARKGGLMFNMLGLTMPLPAVRLPSLPNRVTHRPDVRREIFERAVLSPITTRQLVLHACRERGYALAASTSQSVRARLGCEIPEARVNWYRRAAGAQLTFDIVPGPTAADLQNPDARLRARARSKTRSRAGHALAAGVLRTKVASCSEPRALRHRLPSAFLHSRSPARPPESASPEGGKV